MKVEKVTLPLMATLFLTGNSVALAGTASALDPYAYIQAPSRAEREAQFNNRKTKKIKAKKVAEFKEKAPEPVAKTPSKPATVIISENSPKLEKNKEEKVVKSAASSDTNSDGGFMDGIKQSTGGIAKSTRAVSSGVINGTKSVGSKIAQGFKTAGEKVKDSTSVAGEKISAVPKKLGEGVKSTGEKVKEGSSGVGEKMANGFKAAGGSLAALPKAMGSAASKVGGTAGSAGEGAKKLAAAPVAGFNAIGHGINKLNPFHKDEPAAAVAQKPKAAPEKNNEQKVAQSSASAEHEQTASANSGKAGANAKDPADDKQVADSLDNAPSDSVANAEPKTNEDAAEKVANSGQKNDVPVEQKKDDSAGKVAQTEKSAAAPAEKVAKKEGGLKKRLALAHKSGLGATKAGLDKTRAGIGVLSHGVNKLNPFHKEGKPEVTPPATAQKQPVEAPSAATAQKPPLEAPKQDDAPSLDNQPKLGERIQMEGPDAETAPSNTQSIAAPDSAIPH